jgi:hypothetical protein
MPRINVPGNGYDFEKVGRLPDPLRQIAYDIIDCLNNGIYYAALSVAITIPDICAGLELPLERHVKKEHYESFLKKYATKNLGLDISFFYALRGGIIHRGSAIGHDKIPFGQIVMTITNGPDPSWHGWLVGKGELTDPWYETGSGVLLNLNSLCDSLIHALVVWYDANKTQPNVQNGLSRMARIDYGAGPTGYTGKSVFFGLRD